MTSPFAIGDYLVLTDMYFWNFVGPSAGSLELEVGAVPADTDDKTVTILVTEPVDAFTATSTSLNNHLEWANPNDPLYAHTRILARDDGVFPTDPLDLVNARLVIDDAGFAGQKASVDDNGLTNDRDVPLHGVRIRRHGLLCRGLDDGTALQQWRGRRAVGLFHRRHRDGSPGAAIRDGHDDVHLRRLQRQHPPLHER